MKRFVCTATFLVSILPFRALSWFGSGASAPSSGRTPLAPSGPPPHFSVVPLDRQREGLSQIASLQNAAGSETFLDKMLGTNCYSRAVSELERDCSRLDQVQKSRLALGLANCQLATQGQDTFPCSSSEPLRACVDRLPDRENFMYIEFLTHVDSMCLFVQNQQFEKHTEMMLNTLSEGAGFAKEQLAAMGTRTQELSQDTAAIRAAAADTVARLKEQKELQSEAINVVNQHRAESNARFKELAAQQTEALHLAEQQLEIGKQIEDATEGVERRIISGQTQLESMFGALGEKAVALSQAQDIAAQVQLDLGAQLKSLSDGSKGLRNAVETVAEYQRRSDAALIKLLGRSYTLEDAVFYGAGVLAVMAAGASKATESARLPLFGLLGVNILAERMLLDKLHMWLDVDSAGEVVLTLPIQVWLPTGEGSMFSALQKPLTVNFRSCIRRLCALLCAGILLTTIFSYRDWERANYLRLDQIHRDIQTMNTRHEQLAKEHADLLQARLKALNPKSGSGERERGGRGSLRTEAAPPPPPLSLAGQYLLSNEDERITQEERHAYESPRDYSREDHVALHGNQQLIPLLTSPNQAAERPTAKHSKSKNKGPLKTIEEVAEVSDYSQEGAPEEKTTARRSKRAASITDNDGPKGPEPFPATRRKKTSPSEIEETGQKTLGREKSATGKRKISTSADGSQPTSAAKKKRNVSID